MKLKSTHGTLSALSIAAFALPSISFAQTQTNNLCDVANLGVEYFNTGIELLVGLATVVFIFNIYRYFFTNKEDKAERGTYLMWSVIGFFVILSFWGLVNLLSNTFNLNSQAPTAYGINNTAGCNSSTGGTNSTNGNLQPGAGVSAP
jgi:NADH:ubiquinone oxidoreductase subunit 2 (subunit N)